MISLSTWLFMALGVAAVCFYTMILDKRPWTVEWIGGSLQNLVVRHVVAIIILMVMMAIKAECSIGCGDWFASTIVLLYALAVVGRPIQALLFSGATLFILFIWGGLLGFWWGRAAGSVQFLLFLLSLLFAFIHLRERVIWLQRIPVPSAWTEFIDGPQRTRQSGAKPSPKDEPDRARARVYSTQETSKTNAVSAPLAASGLYGLTLLVEGVAALVRSAVYCLALLFLLLPLYIFLLLTTQNLYQEQASGLFGGGQLSVNYGAWLVGNTGIYLMIAVLLSLGLGSWPLLRSLFHIAFPYTRSGASEQERDALGAREPTRAEHQKIIDALVTIHASAHTQMKIAVPSTWLVIDAPVPDAYTIGSTVYLARAAIEDTHLVGIIAHELGHLAQHDGDVILALRRFIIPLAYFIGIDRQPLPAGAVLTSGSTIQLDVLRNEDEKLFFRFKALQIKLWLAFWCGGIGMFFLGRQWAGFWRARDFLADDYAVQLGQADSLMGILKTYRHVDMAQPFLLTNRPYTAERLDRLQG